jgi:N-methylhydantoinase A/oxoprolinase/acetone carboxylase beta subunit
LLGEVNVSLSHEVGGLGLIERENATILNAGLHSAAREALRAFTEATAAVGISPGRTLFAQNDGTLMSIRQAMRLPVLTIGSGPSNSIRGAAELVAARAGIVVDVGGTTTDIGVLVQGLPRESYGGRIIGGVATNFRIPDVITIPIGGGTIVRRQDGRVTLGPDSVGKDLWSRALVFGGETPTLTDAAVLAGRLEVGSPDRLGAHRELLTEALAASDAALVEALELAKSSRASEDVVVVGGGRSLFPAAVPGTRQLPSPDDADVANAVGAASAAIGAEAEAVIALDATREDEIALIRREAADRAVAAGADPALVEVIDVVEIPLAYLSPPAARLRVRVAAPLAASTTSAGVPLDADGLQRSQS